MTSSSTTPSGSPSYPTLEPFGWSDRWRAQYASTGDGEGRCPGRIVRHDGPTVLTALPDGTRALHLRRTNPLLAVGDWIVADDDSVLELLPRATLLQRADPKSGLEQLLAANVDVVMIVCGLDRPLKTGRIQRAATQAWDSGAVPLLVLTKTDLSEDVDADVATAQSADPNLEVFTVAALDGAGVAALSDELGSRTIVLLGESGAGKSTLVNALAGDDLALTGRVRESDAKGRHTTTSRELHLLPGGGCLIDTPGIRSVGLWADVESVDDVFDDIMVLAEDCRFRDCEHDGEPDCAVADAVTAGTLDADRLEAWHRLRHEARSAALRADEHARRTRDKKFARVTKDAQKRKGRT